MARVRMAWGRVTALFALGFVPVFLAAMLIQNVEHVARRPIPWHQEAADLMAALGTDQYWTMFGAYFPDYVRVPVVQLVLKGGHKMFLLPAVSPEFSDELAASFRLEGLDPGARVARWRTNFGTSRIEKYESRASNPARAWLGVRTAYTADRIRRWTRDEPTRADQIRLVDLLSVRIQSIRDGHPAVVLSIDPLTIDPSLLEDWPARRSRQLFGAPR